MLCGAAAVAGAIWSVFAGFRSGRGVGTAVGTMLVIQPVAVLLAAPVFVGVILLTKYVSLGSLLGSAAMFPAMLLVLLVVPETPLPYVLYAAVGAAFIWLAHADNIDRLIHGTRAQVRPGTAGGQAAGALVLSRRGVVGPGDGSPPEVDFGMVPFKQNYPGTFSLTQNRRRQIRNRVGARPHRRPPSARYSTGTATSTAERRRYDERTFALIRNARCAAETRHQPAEKMPTRAP